MKTTSTFKLRLIEQSIKASIAVKVHLRGDREAVGVSDMKSHGHTVLLTLDRNGGFVAVEPDDIISVWVPKLPAAFQSEAI